LSATGTGFHPGGQQWFTIISAAGHAPVVERYVKELSQMAAGAGATGLTAMESSGTVALLAKISDFPELVLQASSPAVIFRISVLPAAMLALHNQLERIASQNALGLATLTRASGFLYAALLPLGNDDNPFAGLSKASNEIFNACTSPEIGARAMIEWAPTEVKRGISVWGPVRPDFALMRRLKNVFDPQQVLSPGRFAGGI
jgi:FAD/FMN-containing dehydrogenase